MAGLDASDFPPWFEFTWTVAKIVAVLVGVLVVDVFSLSPWAYVALLGVLYFHMMTSHYGLDYPIPGGSIIRPLVVSSIFFIACFIGGTLSGFQPIRYFTVLSLILSMRYFRFYIWKQHLNPIFAAFIATLGRYPVIAAILLIIFDNYTQYNIGGTIWAIGLLAPVILPPVFATVIRVRRKVPFQVRIPDRILLSVPDRVSGALSAVIALPVSLKQQTYQQLLLLNNRVAENTSYFAEYQEQITSQDFFRVAPPDNFHPPNVPRLIALPLAFAMFGGLLTGLWQGLGFGETPQAVHSSIIAISSAGLFSRIVESFLPEGTSAPEVLTRYVIPSWMIIPSLLYPDITAGSMALYPLGLIIFLYIVYKSGLFYGAALTGIGILIVGTALALVGLGSHIASQGYDTLSLALMAVIVILVSGGLFLMNYSIYFMIGHKAMTVYFLGIGVISVLFMHMMFYVGQYAYSLGASYQATLYFFYLVRPIGTLGWLIIAFCIYKYIRSFEQRVVFS